MKNYYDLLEISPGSTREEIRRAYKSLALRWHPDKNPFDHERATEKFKELAEAYSVLHEEDKRRKYDLNLKKKLKKENSKHKDRQHDESLSCGNRSHDRQPHSSPCSFKDEHNDSCEIEPEGFTVGRAFEIFDMLFADLGTEFVMDPSPLGRTGKVKKSGHDHLVNMMMCASSDSTLGRLHRGKLNVDDDKGSSDGVIHILLRPSGALTHMELSTPGRSRLWHQHRSYNKHVCEDLSLSNEWGKVKFCQRTSETKKDIQSTAENKLSHLTRTKSQSLSRLQSKGEIPRAARQKSLPERRYGTHHEFSTMTNSRGSSVPFYSDRYRPARKLPKPAWDEQSGECDEISPTKLSNAVAKRSSEHKRSHLSRFLTLLKGSFNMLGVTKVAPSVDTCE